MNPNKFLTSSSPLQIPAHVLQRSAPDNAPLNGSAQRLASEPAKQAEHAPIAPHESALESADFSAESLSDEQVTVLRGIANGKSIVAAAREAGVGRTTVYRWHHDRHFQKCLQAWKSQTKDSGRNIMLTLIERSARIVERALENDDVRVALTLLTKLGVLAAKEGSFDMIQETPIGGAQDGHALSDVERSAPRKVEGAASSSGKAPAAERANPGPSSLKELHGMINELETKFGDMLPRLRR